MNDDTDRLIEQKIAELTDTQFDALVARTRAPKIDGEAATKISAILRGKPLPKPAPTAETPWIPESPWRPDTGTVSDEPVDPKVEAAAKIRKALGQ